MAAEMHYSQANALVDTGLLAGQDLFQLLHLSSRMIDFGVRRDVLAIDNHLF
jgi:hypothetical protein